MTKLTKWIPTTDLMMLRRMGKLIEELGELQVVASRCIIQGIDEVDPGSGKINRLRLEHEIADVIAQCEVTIDLLNLNSIEINARKEDKKYQMRLWEDMFTAGNSMPVFVVDHIGTSYGEGLQATTVLVGNSLDNEALKKGAKLYVKQDIV